MSTTALALTGYILWHLLLLAAIIGLRLVCSVRSGKPANSYRRDGADVSPFSQRLCGAHANSAESFPFLGGLPLLALATGHTALTDPAALWILGLRLGQSAVHLYAATERAVKVRAALFLPQVLIALYWGLRV
ncbi:MAG: MAPEG family protein, partial [Thiohalorhabdaceae bacterium]